MKTANFQLSIGMPKQRKVIFHFMIRKKS